MRRTTLSMLVLLVLVLVTPVSAHAQQGGVVHGRVLLHDFGMSGVTVTMTQRGNPNAQVLSAITDDRGEYSFPSVPPGEYDLTSTLAGTGTTTRRITVRTGTIQVADVELSPSIRELVIVTNDLAVVTQSGVQVGAGFSHRGSDELPVKKDIGTIVSSLKGSQIGEQFIVNTDAANRDLNFEAEVDQIVVAGSVTQRFGDHWGVIAHGSVGLGRDDVSYTDPAGNRTRYHGVLSAEYGGGGDLFINSRWALNHDLVFHAGARYETSSSSATQTPAPKVNGGFVDRQENRVKATSVTSGGGMTLGGVFSKDRVWFFANAGYRSTSIDIDRDLGLNFDATLLGLRSDASLHTTLEDSGFFVNTGFDFKLTGKLNLTTAVQFGVSNQVAVNVSALVLK